MGRRYCESCIFDDEQLRKSLIYEQAIPRLIQTAIQRQSIKAPQTFSELPVAMINLYKDGSLFFAAAKDTPFKVSFPVAFLALLPNTIAVSIKNFYQLFVNTQDADTFLQTVIQRNTYLSNLSPADAEQVKNFYETVQSIGHVPIITGLVITSIVATIIKVLLLDLVFWGCIRAFTQKAFSYKEASSILHFCLIPLLLCVFATIFDLEIIYYGAFIIMLLQATAASRISTQCTFLQGTGIMILFVTFSTIFGLFG